MTRVGSRPTQRRLRPIVGTKPLRVPPSSTRVTGAGVRGLCSAGGSRADRMWVTSLMTSKHNATTGCKQWIRHQIRPDQGPNSPMAVPPCGRITTCSESRALRAPVTSTEASKPKSATCIGPTRRGELASKRFLPRSSRPTRARPGRQHASDRHAEVNSRRSLICSGPLDLRAQALDSVVRVWGQWGGKMLTGACLAT
jgi:hypothetical protein